jgi:hypothetical protein
MREFFNTAYNLPISEGGIYKLLKRLATVVLPSNAMIKDRISLSKVVGSDETGFK